MELRFDKGTGLSDVSAGFDSVIDAEAENPAIRDALKRMPSDEARHLMAACGFFAHLDEPSFAPRSIHDISESYKEALRALYNPHLKKTELGLN